MVSKAIFLGEELSLGPVSTPGPMIGDQDVKLSCSINMALASPPLQLCMGMIPRGRACRSADTETFQLQASRTTDSSLHLFPLS